MVQLRVDCPPTQQGSEILYAGEAPGAEEARQKQGFVGRAGQVLDACAKVGTKKSIRECDLDNVVHRRPTNNNFAKAFFIGDPAKERVPTEELKEWRARFIERVHSQNYKCIVTCGNVPMWALTGKWGILGYQGSILHTEGGIPVLPVVHPAMILHGKFWHYVPITVKFLQRVAPIINGTYEQPELPQTLVYPRDLTRDELFHMARKAQRWCIDVETNQIRNKRGPHHLDCVGVGFDMGDVGIIPVVFPVHSIRPGEESLPHWNPDIISELFALNPNWVNHEACFDVSWLELAGVKTTPPAGDTLLGHHWYYAEYPANLGFCSTFHLQSTYYKDLLGEAQTAQQLWDYNAADLYYTLMLAREIDKHDAQYESPRPQFQRRLLAQRHAMMKNGMFVEKTRWGFYMDTFNKTWDILQARIDEVAGESLNVKSPKVQELLYDRLGLKKQFDLKSKRPSAGEGALRTLIEQHDAPQVVKDIWYARRLRTLVENYGAMRMRDTGTVLDHCLYQIQPERTETFRDISKKTGTGFGHNQHTIPKSLRYAFVCPDGYALTSPDLSQAEARVVAKIAGCAAMSEAFADPGRNLYLERASAWFGKEITKKDPFYTTVKSTFHAGNYMEGAKQLSVQTGVSIRQASKLLKQLHAWAPEIGEWHKQTEHTLRHGGRLTTPFGHFRVFYAAIGHVLAKGKVDKQHLKDAIAWVPQTTIPRVVNLAMIKIEDQCNDQGIELHWQLQHHDSFLAMFRVDQYDQFLPIVKEAFETTQIPFEDGPIQIPCDLDVGYSWGHMSAWETGAFPTYAEWEQDLEEQREAGQADSALNILAQCLELSHQEVQALELEGVL